MSEPTTRPAGRRRVRPWRLVATLTGLAAATVLTIGVGSAQAQRNPSAATWAGSYSGGGSGGPVSSILGVRWQ
jgi:hypothetical protein